MAWAILRQDYDPPPISPLLWLGLSGFFCSCDTVYLQSGSSKFLLFSDGEIGE